MPIRPLVVHFATFAARPDGEADDRLAVPALAALGIETVLAPWDAPWPRADAPDAVVVRSTWDYFRRIADFRAWLDALDAAGQRTINDTAAMRGNLDKRYLRDLAAAGVPVVETAWPAPGDRLADVLAARGWREAVVKPAVSGGAYETFRVSAPTERTAQDADEAHFAALLDSGAVLVQPFRREVVEAGEWSLIFLGGAFSHAVVKRPAAGDYRVQVQFGGVYTRTDAPDALVGAARAVLAAAGADGLAYARVDGLARADGGLDLMELEVVEPSLFLAHHPDAPARLARALADRLGA